MAETNREDEKLLKGVINDVTKRHANSYFETANDEGSTLTRVREDTLRSIQDILDEPYQGDTRHPLSSIVTGENDTAFPQELEVLMQLLQHRVGSKYNASNLAGTIRGFLDSKGDLDDLALPGRLRGASERVIGWIKDKLVYPKLGIYYPEIQQAIVQTVSGSIPPGLPSRNDLPDDANMRSLLTDMDKVLGLEDGDSDEIRFVYRDLDGGMMDNYRNATTKATDLINNNHDAVFKPVSNTAKKVSTLAQDIHDGLHYESPDQILERKRKSLANVITTIKRISRNIDNLVPEYERVEIRRTEGSILDSSGNPTVTEERDQGTLSRNQALAERHSEIAGFLQEVDAITPETITSDQLAESISRLRDITDSLITIHSQLDLSPTQQSSALNQEISVNFTRANDDLDKIDEDSEQNANIPGVRDRLTAIKDESLSLSQDVGVDNYEDRLNSLREHSNEMLRIVSEYGGNIRNKASYTQQTKAVVAGIDKFQEEPPNILRPTVLVLRSLAYADKIAEGDPDKDDLTKGFLQAILDRAPALDDESMALMNKLSKASLEKARDSIDAPSSGINWDDLFEDLSYVKGFEFLNTSTDVNSPEGTKSAQIARNALKLSTNESSIVEAVTAGAIPPDKIPILIKVLSDTVIAGEYMSSADDTIKLNQGENAIPVVIALIRVSNLFRIHELLKDAEGIEENFTATVLGVIEKQSEDSKKILQEFSEAKKERISTSSRTPEGGVPDVVKSSVMLAIVQWIFKKIF